MSQKSNIFLIMTLICAILIASCTPVQYQPYPEGTSTLVCADGTVISCPDAETEEDLEIDKELEEILAEIEGEEQLEDDLIEIEGEGEEDEEAQEPEGDLETITGDVVAEEGEEETAEEAKDNFIATGFPDPLKRYRIELFPGY